MGLKKRDSRRKAENVFESNDRVLDHHMGSGVFSLCVQSARNDLKVKVSLRVSLTYSFFGNFWARVLPENRTPTPWALTRKKSPIELK